MNKNNIAVAQPLPLVKSVSALVVAAAAMTFAHTAQAADDKRWMVRAGVSQIVPNSDNGMLTAGDIEVDNQVGPSVNLAYYFTPNLAVDVLAALPFRHDFSLNGQPAGDVQHLPPTVTFQYHFLPGAKIQPYIGVGANFTLFMDEQVNGGGDLQLDPSFGLAAQVGVDVPVNDRWVVGFDARYIDIDSDASLNGQSLGTINIDPIVYSLNIGYRF